MLLSMTGFGEAHHHDTRWTVGVEVRSVNNRHLKLTCRLGDRYASFEPDVERIVRETVRRGTVQVTLRIDAPMSPDQYRINRVAFDSYRAQLEESLGSKVRRASMLAAVLNLPGVVETGRANDREDASESWPTVETSLREALERFNHSRAREGQAMKAELLKLGESIREQVETADSLAPEIVAAHRDRLYERVRQLVEERGATLQPADLVREVAIFAERTDIAEEITRLRAHLAQYSEVVSSDVEEAAGRKLEFIVQEMGREANTMGSKAGDVSLSRAVFEIKGALEKIRELIQNIE
jgi:uncharacterized protein (TIGR00255 family)